MAGWADWAGWLAGLVVELTLDWEVPSTPFSVNYFVQSTEYVQSMYTAQPAGVASAGLGLASRRLTPEYVEGCTLQGRESLPFQAGFIRCKRIYHFFLISSSPFPNHIIHLAIFDLENALHGLIKKCAYNIQNHIPTSLLPLPFPFRGTDSISVVYPKNSSYQVVPKLFPKRHS